MGSSRHSPASLSPTEAMRWKRIGALSALAMLLGYLESFVPIPIPGVKLGLANIAVLVTLAGHDVSGAFFVGLVKVLATGLLFGNPVTLTYSATGTLLAFALMAPLSLLSTMRLWMVSVVGALAHEAGQLLVAQLLLGTPLVWYGAPVLAVAGCITGLLCGIAAERAAALLAEAGMTDKSNAVPSPTGPATVPDRRPPRRALLVLGVYLLFVAFAMHARTLVPLVACLAATLLACIAAHLGPKTLWSALAPVLPIAVVTLVAQIANTQQGEVLLTLGSLAVTREAVRATAVMLARLACITCSSVAVVGIIGRERLGACAHSALAPLRAAGLRTQGPELAFATALQLVALLADELPRTYTGRDLLTRVFWNEKLPEIARDLYARAETADRNA